MIETAPLPCIEVQVSALAVQGKMATMDARQRYLAAAFLVGLAAPVGLYAAPPQYPVYLAALSVPWSFANVGIDLNAMLVQNDGRREGAT